MLRVRLRVVWVSHVSPFLGTTHASGQIWAEKGSGPSLA